MAFLFVPSLDQNKNRVFQKSLKAIEVLLLSAGLISTLLMLKNAFLPYYSCEIALFSSLIGFFSSIKCLLSSPFYICIIINFMVMLIAATSSFHNQDDVDLCDRPDFRISEAEIKKTESPEPVKENEAEIKKTQSTEPTKENEPEYCPNFRTYEAEIKKTQSPEPVKESEPEMKESEPEYTMESTWMSITGEGNEKSKKKRFLKKCETWDVQPSNETTMMSSSARKMKELRKSETFNDSVSRACRGGLRRDPSTSLEEFNKQVEAFIKKFNDDMKLQRQESEQRFLDMVKNGI
ncbi:hypothetical protein CASFOL_028010 [Castilleja foliolosa]|uniref:DUF4408 domain-containing protein n=1 Tax=Castilleja foliolosa TaxID=1961234 RepID=A0ABD3CHG1_9LAMI